jgi:molecular chaperone Hsp33
MMESPSPAQVIRALSADKHIRLAALDARPLWDGVRRGHPHLEAEACACLTELLAATLLLQSRSIFVERLQLLVRGAGRAKTIVSDSWPDGMIRGVLDVSDIPEAPWLCAPGLLQVMRSDNKGKPYVGKLPLVEGGISTQIEAYLQQSEQIQASVTIWCDPATGEAGGLMVEPLPNCPPERMVQLIDAIEGLEVVPNWERDPEFLIRWVNQGQAATILSTHEIEYRCRCSKESLLATLGGFSKEKIEEIFTGGSPAEVRCDYCSNVFAIHREELMGVHIHPPSAL